MKKTKKIFLLIILSVLWICKPIPYHQVAYHNYSSQQAVTSSKDGGNTRSTEVDFVYEKASTFRSDPSQINLNLIIPVGSKNFDPKFHRRLEQEFPDWKNRMDYQERQQKYYKLAMRRKTQLRRTKLLDKESYYTKEELDALNYFNGTGFYKQYQDPKVQPNIFDTRQTFLRKMHDPKMLAKFLDDYKFLKEQSITPEIYLISISGVIL